MWLNNENKIVIWYLRSDYVVVDVVGFLGGGGFHGPQHSDRHILFPALKHIMVIYLVAVKNDFSLSGFVIRGNVMPSAFTKRICHSATLTKLLLWKAVAQTEQRETVNLGCLQSEVQSN